MDDCVDYEYSQQERAWLGLLGISFVIASVGALIATIIPLLPMAFAMFGDLGLGFLISLVFVGLLLFVGNELINEENRGVWAALIINVIVGSAGIYMRGYVPPSVGSEADYVLVGWVMFFATWFHLLNGLFLIRLVRPKRIVRPLCCILALIVIAAFSPIAQNKLAELQQKRNRAQLEPLITYANSKWIRISKDTETYITLSDQPSQPSSLSLNRGGYQIDFNEVYINKKTIKLKASDDPNENYAFRAEDIDNTRDNVSIQGARRLLRRIGVVDSDLKMIGKGDSKHYHCFWSKKAGGVLYVGPGGSEIIFCLDKDVTIPR